MNHHPLDIKNTHCYFLCGSYRCLGQRKADICCKMIMRMRRDNSCLIPWPAIVTLAKLLRVRLNAW